MLEKLGCDAIVYTELRNVGIQVWFFSSANFRIWAHADFSFWSSIDLMIIVIFRTLGCIVMYTGTVQAGKQVQQIERIVNFSPILFPLVTFLYNLILLLVPPCLLDISTFISALSHFQRVNSLFKSQSSYFLIFLFEVFHMCDLQKRMLISLSFRKKKVAGSGKKISTF